MFVKILFKLSCDDFFINTTNGTSERVCEYNYNGQGFEYQIVAGPAFILVFTFTGIILSLFADRFRHRRVLILTICLVWWSTSTVLMGLIKSYWQLVVLRFSLGIGYFQTNFISHWHKLPNLKKSISSMIFLINLFLK